MDSGGTPMLLAAQVIKTSLELSLFDLLKGTPMLLAAQVIKTILCQGANHEG